MFEMIAKIVFVDAWSVPFAGVTILLSLTVFLLLVAETMPPTSDAVPLIGERGCPSECHKRAHGDVSIYHCKIFQGLEVARSVFNLLLWNLTAACQTSKRCEHFNKQSRGVKTLRDHAIKHYIETDTRIHDNKPAMLTVLAFLGVVISSMSCQPATSRWAVQIYLKIIHGKVIFQGLVTSWRRLRGLELDLLMFGRKYPLSWCFSILSKA